APSPSWATSTSPSRPSAAAASRRSSETMSALVQIANLERHRALRGDADERAAREQRERQERRTANADRWQDIRPRTAQIYVENRCNLKCNHCYESEESHPPEQYAMSVDDYAKLFDELADLGVLYLTFTGGEIFLRRDMLDIIELARKKRFSVTLFTSGTLIN